METISPEEVNWLRLYRSKNVGLRAFYALIKIYGSATQAINRIESIASINRSKRQVLLASQSLVEQEIKKVSEYGAKLLFSCNGSYPKALHKICDPPPVLTILGNQELINNENIVAIVGARNASTNGIKFAVSLATELGKSGVIIASGLARGIDLAAHQGSIRTGSIAFIAGGIDRIYPKENMQMYQALRKQGAIIAELPISTAPKAQHFPQRNRLISGISQAVAVIEAAKKSGSLITAKIAIQQGKAVFAVPGFPFDPRYAGTNYLLRTGCKFLESAADILEFLGKKANNQSPVQTDEPTIGVAEIELDRYRLVLLNALSYNPTALTEIMQYTIIPGEILNLLLVELELAGKIERTFGNHFNLI